MSPMVLPPAAPELGAPSSVRGALADRFWRRRRSPPERDPGWSLLDAGLVLLVGFGAGALAGEALRLLGEEPSLLRLLGGATIAAVLSGAALLHRLRRRGLEVSSALGFPVGGTGRALLRGVGEYVAFVPVLFAASLASRALFESTPPPRILALLTDARGLPLALALFAIVGVAPLYEEVVYRGFLQPALAARVGSRIAIPAVAAVWALGHEPGARLPIFVLGVFLGFLYRRTGRLGACIGVHALHNALLVGLWLRLPVVRQWTGS